MTRIGLGVVLLITALARAWGAAAYPFSSDDSWFHLRYARVVVETDGLPERDMYEFAPEGRERFYPPLYHLALGHAARLLGGAERIPAVMAVVALVSGLTTTLLIYALGRRIGASESAAVVAASLAALGPALVARTALGSGLPHAPGEALGLLGLLLIWSAIDARSEPRAPLLGVAAGACFAASVLTWNGAVYVWLPVLVLAALDAFVSEPAASRALLRPIVPALLVAVAGAAMWYAPLFLRFGLDPHRPEHEWFFRERTVVLGLRPLGQYLEWGGLALLALPLAPFFRPRRRAIFLLLWLLMGVVLSLRSFRGYTATLPLALSIAAALPLDRAIRDPRALVAALALSLAAGWPIQAAVRADGSERIFTDPGAVAFLEEVGRRAPGEITADADMWITPDQTIGRCRSIVGLYLQYLPADAGERFRAVARLYLLESEEEAAAICRRYGITLVIARKEFLRFPRFLFSPSSGFKEEDYVERRAGGPRFTAKGKRTLLFRMLTGARLEHFEVICEQRRPGADEPDAVASRLRKP